MRRPGDQTVPETATPPTPEEVEDELEVEVEVEDLSVE
jgi:hypothetical protein